MSANLSNPVRIGARSVGFGEPCYIIAEVGANHDGELSLALEYVDAVAEAGADAVKFQSLSLGEQYHPSLTDSSLQELHATIDIPDEWYPQLFERARARKVDFISSPTFPQAVDLLVSLGVPALKIASPQAYGHLELVRYAGSTGLPLILSTGYCTYGDIEAAVAAALSGGAEDIVLLHCVAAYPTRPEDANLRAIRTLVRSFDVPVGLSDHSLGLHLPVAARALGAVVLEKHVSFDRERPGPDHSSALEMASLATLVRQIREVEAALGSGLRNTITREEEQRRERLIARLIAARDLRTGEVLRSEDVLRRRARAGVPARELASLLGRRILRDIPAGETLEVGVVGSKEAE